MPIQVLMPALSPTMTDGKLSKWLKSEGDAIAAGDAIAEIETDKATMEVEAVDEGILGRILVAEGTEGVAVNLPIALILEDGEDASALDTVTTGTTKTPAPSEKKPSAPESIKQASAPQSAGAQTAGDSQVGGSRVFASPLAKRLATEAGLDLGKVTGTGPRGRIVKKDIEAAKAGGAARAASLPSTPVASGEPHTAFPNSMARKVIAKRLGEAKRDIPHFYLTIDCEIDALLDARKQLNERSPEGGGAFKLSVNDLIVKAVALALREVPAANATWTDEAILRFNTIDVSVAVATPNGLITPVLRNADTKGLAALSNEMKDLATRARDAKLMPEEYQGGGFTISNLGMFGIREFSAIINPPQSCILAVGAGEQRPVVRDGQLAIATVMTCTLSVDHRSVDGAVGAEFLAAFRKFIECPMSMIL
ncbi:MAG: pyruvate dehydrogenase complex dihydrolipoamide acetyltransferase [Rhodospirillales bacterium]|nr:pyruvate dehydrogenase complex dihydrolipoamide acetyltransferase [Rhodospirillales bacterium]